MDCGSVDALMRGLSRMKALGHEPVWGPGRHGPGGNVFCYFEDPTGFVPEYTCEVIQIPADGRLRPSGRLGEIGPATDVYSLGAILYQLLTGQPPHRGATALETVAKVVADDPTAPRTLTPDVPADLETICLKCLEKRPERRYATARLLAEEVERFLKGEPILAKPAGATRKIWSWATRHPWIITGGNGSPRDTSTSTQAWAWHWRTS